MGLNINAATKRRQLAILIGAIIIGGSTAAGVVIFGQEGSKPKTVQKPATPNLTGVMTTSFTDSVRDSALAQQQAKTSSLESELEQMKQSVAQMRTDFDKKMEKKDKEIEQLKTQTPPPGAAAPASGNPAIPGGLPPGAQVNGTPVPAQLTGQARPPEYSVTPIGSGARNVNPYQGAGFYPGGSGQQLSPGLQTKEFTYEALKAKDRTTLPWVPSGSFSDAIMIEGADANASVTGSQNTTPVTFRLQGNVQMPNNHEYNMDGCFVSGEIFGDISSERGEVRTSSISCILKNGKHVDMAFDGHVSYQGKEGIRGKPVMRNGQIVGYAGAAGFLSGIGAGVKSAATPTVGLGGSASVGGLDVLKQGFGGGAEKAADTLSQYWIKRAEQYHPVIDIGAGNRVTVVFQKGFRLETMEDAEAKKAEAAARKTSERVQNVNAVAGTSGSGASSTSTTPIGSINPDEVLKQARQLRLGDAIN